MNDAMRMRIFEGVAHLGDDPAVGLVCEGFEAIRAPRGRSSGSSMTDVSQAAAQIVQEIFDRIASVLSLAAASTPDFWVAIIGILAAIYVAAGGLKACAWADLIQGSALVIGGGVAGMTAALNLADQGFPIHLVEKEDELGGLAGGVHRTLDGSDVQAFVKEKIAAVENHANITIIGK